MAQIINEKRIYNMLRRLKSKQFFLTIIILFSLSFLFVNCSENKNPITAENPPTIDDTLPAPERMTFTGVGEHGIFDPSLESATSDRVWMSFSSVDTSTLWPTENYHAVTTHLAHSEDGGENWVYSKALNSLKDVDISGLSYPFNTGTWHNEVSSLVYEPNAPVNSRWKIIWHRYLMINFAKISAPPNYEGRRFEHGWISYKEAASPEQLSTATEIKLFGTFTYNTVNNDANGITQPPVAGAPLIDLSTLHSDLNACAVFTEPSLFYHNNKIYLAIACVIPGAEVQLNTVLLSCNSPCDFSQASNWTYIATLLTNTTAVDLGYLRLNGPDLFKASDNSIYLSITPVTNSPFTDSYNGCLFFKFSDIETGTLITENSQPQIFKSYFGESDSFNGACSYDASATYAGVLHSQLTGTTGEMFRIFKTFLKF